MSPAQRQSPEHWARSNLPPIREEGEGAGEEAGTVLTFRTASVHHSPQTNHHDSRADEREDRQAAHYISAEMVSARSEIEIL